MRLTPPITTRTYPLLPYTTLFRSLGRRRSPFSLLHAEPRRAGLGQLPAAGRARDRHQGKGRCMSVADIFRAEAAKRILITDGAFGTMIDRKSTRLNSSH